MQTYLPSRFSMFCLPPRGFLLGSLSFYFTLFLNVYLAEDTILGSPTTVDMIPRILISFVVEKSRFLFTSPHFSQWLFQIFSLCLLPRSSTIVYLGMDFFLTSCLKCVDFLNMRIPPLCFFLPEFDSHVELTLSLMSVSFLSVFFNFISWRSILDMSLHPFSVHKFLSYVFLTCP